MSRLRLVLALAAACIACSAPPRTTAVAASATDEIESAIAALSTPAALQMRYNPAACDCPAVEVQLASRWIRAELVGGGDPLASLLSGLAARPIQQWPIAFSVRGSVDRELRRSRMGLTTVRVEVSEIVSQPAGAPADVPAAAPEPAAEGSNP